MAPSRSCGANYSSLPLFGHGHSKHALNTRVESEFGVNSAQLVSETRATSASGEDLEPITIFLPEQWRPPMLLDELLKMCTYSRVLVDVYHLSRLLSSMEYYDIKRNKWTRMKSSLPQATMAMGAALFRSLVWIAGGVVDSGSNNLDCSSAVQCYNPETKAWTFMAPTLPTSCGYLSLVSDGSSLLAVGGSVSLDQLQLGSVPDVHALSADQRTWEPMPFLPRPCHSSAAVAFGANLYVFGGISNGNVLADVQVLQKGRWTTCAHLQATLLGLSAVALPPAHATPPELDPLDKGRRDDDLIVWSWHNL